jgi:hypothetical protein
MTKTLSLRVLRNFAIVLLTCWAPAVCIAAVQLGVEVFDGLDGAAILAVKPGSVADANGLRANDRIVQIDKKKISSSLDLQDELQGMTRWKRNVRITVMRHGGFVTVPLKKKPFRARPFVVIKGENMESAEGCLSSPSVDCLRVHLLTGLKNDPDANVGDAADVSRQFMRIGRPDVASEFLDVATELFLARPRVLAHFEFVSLAKAYRAAGVPLPSAVQATAAQIAKQNLKYAIRGLHIAGESEFAQRLLQEARVVRQTKDQELKELSAYWYTDMAIGYAVLGDLQSAEAVKLDPRFSPEERLELDLAIARALVEEQRLEDVPKALDAPLASYRMTSQSMDYDHFSEAAWLYWQSGKIAATEQLAEYLLARVSAGDAVDVSRRSAIDAAVEVLGLLGRIPEALTLIEASMAEAPPARKAEVDYRLISGAMRRSGQDELDPRLRPVADRALANWRRAYAEAASWPKNTERSISRLYQLLVRNGSAPPSASETEWPPGPAIDAATRKLVASAIATGVLTGLNEARRTDIGPAWAMSARASLLEDRRGRLPLTFMVMLVAADGYLDRAIRFGEEVFGEDPQLEVARDEARSVDVRSLIAAKDFHAIAQIYGKLTRPIQKMNVLLKVLIPISGRCDTCTL